MKRNITLFLFLALAFTGLKAQELPPIEVYTPQEYGAENQNWGITQAKNGYVYAGNNKGLLEFNGARWQVYPSPNETILRSVHAVDDLVYSGCYMEFGFWKRNTLGQLVYISLSDKLTTPLIDDEQFWKIFSIEDWVLFQSLNRIYLYHTQSETFHIINADIAITKMYQVGNEVYFQSAERGLFKIENGSDVLVSDHPVFLNNIIVNVFKQGQHLLVETMQSGFYVLSGNTVEKWEIPANELLSKVSVYNSIQLKDGSYALGTISKGLIHLTKDGRANYEINQAKGFSNNTVLSLFEGSQSNIWLGLDNGINCVNITSPYRIFTDDKGAIGTVYASKIFDDNLYLGTNQGLFFKPVDNNQDFTFIEGTKGQVWCLEVFDNTLFCGHNLGTFTVEGKKATRFSSIDGTWGIKPLPGKNLLLQGNYNGLNVIEKQGNSWVFKNQVEGFNNSSKDFELLNDSTIFVNHEYKGVFKITVDSAYRTATKVELNTIEKGLNSSIAKYKGNIVYAYREGVFKYDKNRNRFVKDSVLSQFYTPDHYTSGRLIKTENGILWGFSDKHIGYLTQSGLSNLPQINKVAFSSELRKSMAGYENITHLKDKQYLFGSSTGYSIIDLDKIKTNSFSIVLNTVKNHAFNTVPVLVDTDKEQTFKNKFNNVEVSFSIPNYNKFQKPEFQYQLVGLFNSWSSWSESSSELFKSLPHGSYTFKVRGRVGDTLSDNVATYSFVVEKPWHLSTWAVACYVLLFVLLSLVVHQLYKRYFKNQQRKLLKEAEHEMKVAQLENKQQVMRLKNEKLEQDVESKNRELAISTMSLIKKNEFLNAIKSELKRSKDDKNVKSVIKIIDKNLNNSDDWNFFEEAFNNADKDFLKKVKEKHPELTPNDLKLCAYLRLNLSSKEIAPLLNISTKSVEVKRYRLRKKMQLPHEASLTNYILDI